VMFDDIFRGLDFDCWVVIAALAIVLLCQLASMSVGRGR